MLSHKKAQRIERKNKMHCNRETFVSLNELTAILRNLNVICSLFITQTFFMFSSEFGKLSQSDVTYLTTATLLQAILSLAYVLSEDFLESRCTLKRYFHFIHDQLYSLLWVIISSFIIPSLSGNDNMFVLVSSGCRVVDGVAFCCSLLSCISLFVGCVDSYESVESEDDDLPVYVSEIKEDEEFSNFV